jgi:hypothetical protein
MVSAETLPVDSASPNWEVLNAAAKRKPDDHNAPGLDARDAAVKKKAWSVMHEVGSHIQCQ